MFVAKDADNSTSSLDLDSRSFETLNILKEANFYQRCGSEGGTFTKDMSWQKAKK